MTMDGWGDIGRQVLRNQNMLSAFYIVLFIFIMNYLFWNILVGIILDLFRESNSKSNTKKELKEKEEEEEE